MKILVTGATGFIGQKLIQYLLEYTDATLHLVIRADNLPNFEAQRYNHRIIITRVDNISSNTNWQETLVDCQVIIHAAARVHIMNEQSRNPLKAFREVNVEGTLHLAKEAALRGVKRFIYLSSIKVNGEYSSLDKPFGPNDIAMPEHPYSISKYEAEQGLMNIAEKNVMSVVIIRPPLVYGPGVSGNFLRLIQLLQKGMPLPFGGLNKNKRSFVSVNNLITLIVKCIDHPQAANQIFLVSDDDDLSTTELFCKIRQLLSSHTLLVPVPSWVLNGTAVLLGKKAEMMRICGSLQVDISKSKQLLHWLPTESVDNALYRTIENYIDITKMVSA